jgi:hypothetical protein
VIFSGADGVLLHTTASRPWQRWAAESAESHQESFAKGNKGIEAA